VALCRSVKRACPEIRLTNNSEEVVAMLRALVVLLALGSLAQAKPPTILAEGDWSKPVGDNRGREVRGRLVLGEKRVSAERREIIVYVELQEVSDSIGWTLRLFCDVGRHDFRPEYKGGLRCELRDKDKQLIKPTSYPFGGGVPQSEWVSLPPDATIRLRTTPFGIHRPGAMAISPELGTMWVIGDDDSKEYFLSGTFSIDPTKDQAKSEGEQVWRGTIELPAVKIVNKK
jgi:hypothetical protein